MDISNFLNYWKQIAGILVVTVGATVSVITWADSLIKQELTIMKAQESLIHNDYYQNGRIDRKELEIKEHQRELKRILADTHDRDPSVREAREIQLLDDEIARLRKEIEEIRVSLAKAHE